MNNRALSEVDEPIQDIKEVKSIRRSPQKQPSRASGVTISHRREKGGDEDSRHKSTSRSHIIECRKVSRNGPFKHERGSVQKIEIVPRKASERASAAVSRSKPRQRNHTRDNNATEISSTNSHPSSSVVKTNGPNSTRSSKPNAAHKKPVRARQSSRHPSELEAGLRNNLDDDTTICNNNLGTTKVKIADEKEIKPEKRPEIKQAVNLTTKPETETNRQTKTLAEETETAIQATNEDFAADDEEADAQNDKLVKMLKKIDTQTLKRRLSLDQLDDLDTDDEVLK